MYLDNFFLLFLKRLEIARIFFDSISRVMFDQMKIWFGTIFIIKRSIYVSLLLFLFLFDCCFFAFLFYANRIRDYGARDGCTFASQTWFWIIPLEPNVTVSPGWMKSEQPWERTRRLKLCSDCDEKHSFLLIMLFKQHFFNKMLLKNYNTFFFPFLLRYFKLFKISYCVNLNF